MKKFFITVVLSLSCVLSVSAQKQTEASTLNLIGKPFESTPIRIIESIHWFIKVLTGRRIDNSVVLPVWLCCLKRTRVIYRLRQSGDMYIRAIQPCRSLIKDMIFISKMQTVNGSMAASGSLKAYKGEKTETFTLIENMDGTMHECMMYMPMYSEVISCKIGIDDDAVIEPLKSDFRHRIAVYGSSFTQGVSTDRSGMSYPMQFMRNTGLQVVSLATSGRCLMQPYMLDVLAEVKADAFIFDTFSNPDAELIRERLMPFIDRLIAAHPATPLIFQRTIYRERRSFDTVLDAKERAKAATVEELFAKIRTNPKYKDVYLITPDASDAHETSVDGTHPSSYGYVLWAKSIETPVIEILSKYGIK